MFNKIVIKFNENLKIFENKYILFEKFIAKQINIIVDIIIFIFIDASISIVSAILITFVVFEISKTSKISNYFDEKTTSTTKNDENSRDVYTRLRRTYAKIFRYLYKI